jgi:hypothetical protein
MPTLKVLLTAIVVGALALGLLGTAALAQQAPPTGTLTGVVTWGPDAAPAAFTMVGVEGTQLTARTDATGKFTIPGVPVDQTFTINAYSDPMQSVATSRYNVVLNGSDTLDIGQLNLPVQPQEMAPPLEVIPAPSESQQGTA